MGQETLYEGVGRQLGYFDSVALASVAKGKVNLVAIDVKETMVGNGDAMGIAGQIAQGLLGLHVRTRRRWLHRSIGS